ncbi:MAG: dihydrolipoamide succinyltransferase, partial [Alphaproteobacteria bacterium]|nr:dihydrolipoamide succinyltransferase [Alphaproteobacteria bacterium]
MTVEIKVPKLAESITEATIAKWFKAEGDAVAQDEALCELETDKVTVEVPAPAAGRLDKILSPAGTTVAVGAVIAALTAGAAGKASAGKPAQAAPAKAAAAPAAA